MTEKRKYEKPSMEPIECEQEQQLLAGSGQVNATMDSTWEEEDL